MVLLAVVGLLNVLVALLRRQTRIGAAPDSAPTSSLVGGL